MANTAPQDFKGHRWVAAIYDRFNRRSEKTIMRKYRPFIIGEATGYVLELGAGTGASFPYYHKAEKVIATEPDPYMLEKARKRLQELGLTHIELAQHPAEELPFEDRSFDHVVSTLVFCTVRDPRRALAEAKRVLKPDGTFRYIEHVRNDDSFVGNLQDWLTPLWKRLAAGCHMNRRTADLIEEAGFRMEDLRRIGLAPGFPGIVGIARPT